MTFFNRVKKYFKNEGYFYIFLLAYEGSAKTRNYMLGVTDDLYTDKAKAIKWYKRIYKKISPFENEVNHRDYKEAVRKLQDLFENMTDSEV